MSFFVELKRRNVFRVGIAYAIIAWLLAQVADLALENFGAPDWVIKSVLLLLIIGFPLAIFFAWAFELTPEGLKREKEVDRTQSITSQTGRKLDRAIIAVLALALGYFMYDKFTGNQPVEQTTVVVEDTTPAAMEKSIAVLPFVNMSSDAEQEYFSDGISEEILNALAKVKDLKVAGRTSSFAFKGQNQDLRMIGETLGVNHILEGSVRKAGDKVRITAQLIKVDDGFHLWSDTYDRELTDVFAIQDEIANAILQQMKAALLDDQSIATTEVDTLAYDLYLLAKQKIRDRNESSLEQARSLLDQAIERDSYFAAAYAQRAIAEMLLSDGDYGTIPVNTTRQNAKPFIDKSLELDPALAEAWASFGLYWNQSQLASERANGIEPLLRALEINPSLTNASNWLQSIYRNQGKLSDATRILEQLLDRDPLYRPAIGNAIVQYEINGQLDKAWQVLDTARPFFQTDPIFTNYEATALVWEGRESEALPLSEAAWEALPNDSSARFMYALTLWSTGQFEKILELNGNDWRVPALSRLGRTEEATLLAYRMAASGEDVTAPINLLGRSGRFEELIEYFESRWPGLDAWERDFPGINGFGNMNLALLAHAYRAIGDDAKFTDAMTRLEKSISRQRSEGADNPVMMQSEAYFHMLAGNEQATLDTLDEMARRGWGTTSALATDLPVLKLLAGDPRFQDIEQRMIAHTNAERARLDLPPLELDRTL
jgi:TolB-like protein